MRWSAENSKSTVHECQVTSFEALMAAMRHPAVTSDPQTVCSLLQTCKSWRSALQQSGANNMVIRKTCLSSLRSVNNFALFASWIPKHAALLSEIHLDSWDDRDYFTAMAELLVFAMQHAAAASQMRLTSFSTNFLGNATLLQQLLPASLTQLAIDKNCSIKRAVSINSTAVCSAIGCLTALQDLSIAGQEDSKDLPSDGVLQAISKLQHLTSLNLEWVAAESNLGLLPAQLLLVNLKAHCGSRPITLAQLTALRQLGLSVAGTPAPGSCLPQHLTNLTVERWDVGNESDHVNELGIAGMQQLRQLQLVDCLQDPELLQQLSSLQHLQDLTLGYFEHSKALSAAAAYSKLHHLRALWIEAGDAADLLLTQQEQERFCRNLGAATSLRELSIISGCGEVSGASLCQHLIGLQQLQGLVLKGIGAPDCREDAYYLTALTGLTKLVLECAPGVDDAAVIAVACSLKELQELSLFDCSVCNAAVLPAIALLTKLTELSINNCPVNRMADLAEHDIMRLTTLTGLRSLEMCEQNRTSIPDEIFDRFWAAVRAAHQHAES